MIKSLTSALVALVFSTLTACGGAHIHIEDGVYDDYGYLGDYVAGQSFTATHIELGLSTGNIYEITPGSLQISFDPTANFVTGNKNCNVFQAETIWHEFGLELRPTIFDNQFCSIELSGFPEELYITDVFRMEIYTELGRQTIALYSENQEFAIYLSNVL